jgi:hypothetical protein
MKGNNTLNTVKGLQTQNRKNMVILDHLHSFSRIKVWKLYLLIVLSNYDCVNLFISWLVHVYSKILDCAKWNSIYIIGLLHYYWGILSRAVYHMARACKRNMIYCEGQYSSILVQKSFYNTVLNVSVCDNYISPYYSNIIPPSCLSLVCLSANIVLLGTSLVRAKH